MSLHRYAPKRDANEPAIRKRFAHHGWHTEQMSGAGMPDLLAFALPTGNGAPAMKALLVDVKTPTGKATKAQDSKWAYLRLQGIPVYVVRTEGDVDELVAGTLEPWQPEPVKKGVLTDVAADTSSPLRVVRSPGSGTQRAPTAAVYRRGTP